MKLAKQNSRTFQEQILEDSLFQGLFKNHFKEFKDNSRNPRNSRTAGHPVHRYNSSLVFLYWYPFDE